MTESELLDRITVVGRTALETVLGAAEAKARNGLAGALEEDARLTALFLWTLQATTADGTREADAPDADAAGDETDEDAADTSAGKAKGFSLVFDVVRRFAQPLGIDLEKWERRTIETKKGIVRLLPVAERAARLFGRRDSQAVASWLEQQAATGTDPLQGLLFSDRPDGPPVAVRERPPRYGDADRGDNRSAGAPDATTLDRVHTGMLLQAGGRTNALRALVHAERRRSPDFLRLANALSALYPRGSDEASAQLAARVVGAYATVREQFDTPIGRFEGIEEPLARIGGLTYTMNAVRTLTAGAVDAGERPSVLSAVAKAYLTEAMRDVVNDAMDIRAGAAICRGPRNILANAYQAVPIGITVEGANILTRSMIVYGQGAIRSHPFVQDEMRGAAERDVARFDRAFFGHVGFVVSTAVRALLLGLTGGRLARPRAGGSVKRYFGQLTRMSSAFAVVSDTAMGTLGGKLKRREKISGRLADTLAWMYLGSAALKRFIDEGEPEHARPFIDWSCQHALHEIQSALLGLLRNLPNTAAAWALRPIIFPLGPRHKPPSDELGSAVARALLDDPDARALLTKDMYVPGPFDPGLGRLEAALGHALPALAVERKIRDAVRAGVLDKAPGDVLLVRAVEAGVITEEEQLQVMSADALRDEVIQVDAFDKDDFVDLRG